MKGYQKMNIGQIIGFGSVLGFGLAMDAFSVSLANGLHEPSMKKRKMCAVAGIFAFFQAIMPMIGWISVHLFLEYFNSFSKFIPWIALILLSIIILFTILTGGMEEESETGTGGALL